LNFLTIDASTEACSVALTYNNQTSYEFELAPQSHSLVLLPMVDRLLKQVGCQLSELDGLIFGQGPGSFTGVRIGVGVAQGLAFSAQLKVVGVSTLQALAQQAYCDHKETEVITAIDARMSEVYAGFYRLNDEGIMTPVMDEVVLSPEKLAQHLVENTDLATDIAMKAYGVGSGWDAYPVLEPLKSNEGSPEILFPHAKAMLMIGREAFKQGLSVSAEYAQPKYVRDTVSWKKLPGR